MYPYGQVHVQSSFFMYSQFAQQAIMHKTHVAVAVSHEYPQEYKNTKIHSLTLKKAKKLESLLIQPKNVIRMNFVADCCPSLLPIALLQFHTWKLTVSKACYTLCSVK